MTQPSPTQFGKALRIGVIVLGSVVVSIAGFLFLRQALNTRVFGLEWDSRHPGFVEDVDHSRWDRLLKKYVDDQGLVRYRAWHSNEVDRAALHDYLELLAITGIDSDGHLVSRGDRNASLTAHEIAYWVNAHNALLIEGILAVYPTDSIRQHVNPVGYDIQQHLKLMTGGRAFSLDDIIRTCLASFHDPRVRFGITNASKSCPALLNRAWTASEVEKLLEQCAGEYLNSTSHVSLDSHGELHLAKMLDEDYDGEYWSAMGSWRRLTRLIKDPLVRQRIESGDAKIVSTPHDWSLNDKR